MHNLVALRRKENQDGEEKTYKGPGCGEFQEDLVVEPFAANLKECKPSEDGGTKGNAKEDAHTGCNCGI